MEPINKINGIKYEHTFLQQGIKAFIEMLDRMFEPYLQMHLRNKKFPIYINSSGDETYMSNLTDIGENEKQLYEYVPRISFRVAGISVENDQMTAFSVPAQTNVLTKEQRLVRASTHVRRIPLKVSLQGEAVFGKFHEMLTFIEYLMSVTSHMQTAYQFAHQGIVHGATFDAISDYEGTLNYALEFSSEKREIRLPLNFDIGMQFPALNMYKATGFDYYEMPGIHVAGVDLSDKSFDSFDALFGKDFDSNCPTCNSQLGTNAQNCKECGDFAMAATKWIHRMHLNDPSVRGIVSITEITGKQKSGK